MTSIAIDSNETESSRPAVAIVFYETYLGCAPSIINAARVLDERGYSVDILIRQERGRFAEPPSFGPNVRVVAVDGKANSPRVEPEPTSMASSSPSNSWLRRVVPQTLRRSIGCLLQSCRDNIHAMKPSTKYARERFAKQCVHIANKKRYACVIGADTIGLVVAHQIAEPAGTQVIYWSLEIMFESDFPDKIGKWWKQQERLCHQRSLALVIQDNERAASLSAENDAEVCPVILVPNSPRGYLDDQVRRDYFHRMFDLKEDCRVVLHAGSVCEGMRSYELAQAAATWPTDTKLVFHSHTQLNRHDDYAHSLVPAGKGNVLLSTDPVDYDMLDELVSSAWISLVIYDVSLGPNFALLAGASGKLAHSLRCGVPVISIGNASIGRVLTQHGCGISVDSPGEIGAAIQSISNDYATYQKNAFTCYDQAYEFDKHFDPVMKLIDQEGGR
ncbi:hypothetical protein CA13_26650 [Planctomycetes bacterium CA13]|uniref:Glycosyl transferases group 1 n=1 Tax=Novipirellula herctigrandis TaxID=2527986 RepID=A0A5C5Z2G8_9BACT|nr:hypothetical protein CA13_26650 [Planctomycetes bacterium CA13]